MTSEKSGKGPVSRKIFTAMAVATLLMGVALYLFRDWWGLDHGTAVLLAVAFTVVGLADLLIAKNWDRLFAARGQDSER